MKTMNTNTLRACGGYHFEGHYVNFVIHGYAWGDGHELFVRDSWLDGVWVGTCRSYDSSDDLLPPMAN